MNFTYRSVCSGIEAATVAWESLGWEPLSFSEIEPFPSAVLAHHWPDVPNEGDMMDYKKWNNDRRTNLIVGGTPCQSFSVAGLRKGLKDPRGNLTLGFLAVVEHFDPDFVVWENVPGVLSDKGNAFGQFLAGLEELGYEYAYRVLDAQYFGVPQRRRRVFVVACSRRLGIHPAEILFEPESLCWDITPSREAGQGTPADAGEGTTKRSHWEGGVHPSLNQAHNTGGIGMSNQEIFSQKGAGLVGIPQTVGTLCADSHPGSYTGQDVYTGRLIPHICIHGTQDPCTSEDTSFALGRNNGGENVICYPIQDQATRHAGNGGKGKGNGLGIGEDGEPCPTLTAGDKHAVAFGVNGEPHTGHCLRSGASKADKTDSTTYIAQPVAFTQNQRDEVRTMDVAGALAAEPGMKQQTYIRDTEMQVRRLTPLECERLQGFPDDHTLIPWRGKTAEECPDGPRYQACGNSMAVPVMRWIGERIQSVITNH